MVNDMANCSAFRPLFGQWTIYSPSWTWRRGDSHRHHGLSDLQRHLLRRRNDSTDACQRPNDGIPPPVLRPGCWLCGGLGLLVSDADTLGCVGTPIDKMDAGLLMRYWRPTNLLPSRIRSK